MRRTGILLWFSLLLISCGRAYTHRQAISHRTESEIDMTIEFFSRCYYRLPSNLKELEDFIDATEWYKGIEIKDRPFFASYCDSVFLYFRRQQLGCCVYGHPIYWLQNPDKYPIDRLDYFENFKISGFDKNGKYVFCNDYDSLSTTIKDISLSYNSVISCQSRIFSPWREDVTLGPKLFLAEYLAEDGAIKIVDEQKHEGDMYLSDIYNPTQTYSVIENLDAGEGYLKSIERELLCFGTNHPKINRIVVPLNIFCDSKPNQKQ